MDTFIECGYYFSKKGTNRIENKEQMLKNIEKINMFHLNTIVIPADTQGSGVTIVGTEVTRKR